MNNVQGNTGTRAGAIQGQTMQQHPGQGNPRSWGRGLDVGLEGSAVSGPGFEVFVTWV